MLPERKRKAAKKRGYDVRTDSHLRHNKSTRSIPAHIRSYDNNGRSGAVTPSNMEPQQKRPDYRLYITSGPETVIAKNPTNMIGLQYFSQRQ